MSHVDDGELTAYADGAYPVNDPEALRISAHLSTCANCRTRVEQSQELRSRAGEILSYAAPMSVQAPAFETLQTRAQPRRVTMPHLTSLAWAATIVLALGIGWFGRGAFQGVPARDMIAVQNEAAAPENAATPGVQSNASPTEVATPPAAAAPAPAVDNRVAASGAAAATEEARVETDRAQAFAAEGAARNAARRAPSPQTGDAAVAAPPPAPVREESVAERAQDRVALEAQIAPTGAASYSPAEAERAGLEYPRIPELPVMSVTVSSGEVLVQQALPDGKVVRLTAVTATAQEGGRAAAPLAAQKQVQSIVRVMVGDKLVTLTGDLPADSLRALAAKVR